MRYISAYIKNPIVCFVLFTGLYLTLKAITDQWFLTDDSLYDYYKERYNEYRLDKFVENRQKFQILNYLLPTIYYFLKFSLISGVIAIGVYFRGKEISFVKIFTTVCIAELCFLIPTIVKHLWFGFWVTDFSVEEYKSFGSVSLIDIYHMSKENKLYYLFKTLNIYELIYIFTLSYGIKLNFKFSLFKSFRLIISTYGILLLFYFSLIMFIITLKN